MNYYNEFDPKAAEWLRELIKTGEIPAGFVDTRSITDVQPDDLKPFNQCHFFAGIGGWSLALKLAGWPKDRPIWTGSCPCQPFSAAGKHLGVNDPRHLWPQFGRLISARRPPAVFGEQVASKAGRLWLAGVRSDLEAMGYAVGASDLCSAGVGSPNIRQRLYWMAHPGHQSTWRSTGSGEVQSGRSLSDAPGRGALGRLANPDGRQSRNGQIQPGGESGRPDASDVRQPGETDARERDWWLGNSDQSRPQRRVLVTHEHPDQRTPWTTSELIDCTDGKARRVEPGTFPLAHGISGRVGLLRGYGNAINPYVAKIFIEACEDARLLLT